MIQRIPGLILLLIAMTACNDNTSTERSSINSGERVAHDKGAYSEVNGINMYYETYGEGKALVLLHGGGSTIETSFGRIIPLLEKNRKLICIELQAHGRTGDRNTELSFEQDADDVAALLKNINVDSADILGFSNGGNTALKIAIRHPQICNKIIAASPLLKTNGTEPQFWEFMKKGTFEQMPSHYKEAFLKVNPDSTKLMNMFRKCADRMINFKEFSDEEIRSIQSDVLLINGDKDVASSEHIVAMSKMIPRCRLAIIPGGHGAYIGEITTLRADHQNEDFIIPLIERFLNGD